MPVVPVLRNADEVAGLHKQAEGFDASVLAFDETVFITQERSDFFVLRLRKEAELLARRAQMQVAQRRRRVFEERVSTAPSRSKLRQEFRLAEELENVLAKK